MFLLRIAQSAGVCIAIAWAMWGLVNFSLHDIGSEWGWLDWVSVIPILIIVAALVLAIFLIIGEFLFGED